jgi:hypothetical protein
MSDRMTIAELAAELGLNAHTVRKGVRNGTLPGRYVGGNKQGKYGTFYIRREWVERFIETGEWLPTKTTTPLSNPFIRRVNAA